MYKQDLVISLGKLEDFKLQSMVKFPSLRGIGLSAVIMKGGGSVDRAGRDKAKLYPKINPSISCVRI